MSYQVAGRMSWLVSWLDHWRGHAYTNHSAHVAPRRWRAWTNWRATHWLNEHWLNSVPSDRVSSTRAHDENLADEGIADHSIADENAVDEELLSQTLAARQLRESVEHLPSHERQVLLLHVNHGLTYWEIAARLGMDEEVVLRDLAHAYSQLRLELSADEPRR